MSEKRVAALRVVAAAALGEVAEVIEYENTVYLNYSNGASVRVYFSGKQIDEIHTVDCVIDHEKTVHTFSRVK